MSVLWPIAVAAASVLAGGTAYLASTGSDGNIDVSSLRHLTGRSADMEPGNFSDFDKVENNGGSLVVSVDQVHRGSYSAKATQESAVSASYARGIFMGTWGNGVQVNYGLAVYLPPGFFLKQRSQVDLARFDNFSDNSTETERVGLVVQSNHKLYLVRQKHLSQQTLLGPFSLSEGRWNVLEVRQRLGNQQGALNAVYINGEIVGANDMPNSYGNPYRRLRVGLVASTAKQELPLSLYFDDARLASL